MDCWLDDQRSTGVMGSKSTHPTVAGVGEGVGHFRIKCRAIFRGAGPAPL